MDVSRAALAALCLCSIGIAVACSDSTGGAGGGDGGTDVDAGDASAEAPLIVNFVVRDLYAKSAVEGAEVCILEHDEVTCNRTNALGQVTLNDVPRGEISVGIKKAAYNAAAFPVDTSRRFVGRLTLQIISVAEIQARRPGGAAYDLAAATIVTTDFNAKIKGPYTLSLTPASGSQEVTGELITLVGVTPGPFELTATPPPGSPLSCANKGAVPWTVDDRAGVTRGKAFAGYVTAVDIVCE